MEENLNLKIKDIHNKFEEKNNIIKDLKENFSKLEKEYKDLVNIIFLNFLIF
jgi:hypothetical protein